MFDSIDHVNLVVADMSTMKNFYRDVLGLEVTKEVTIRGQWIEEVVGLKDVEADVVYLELADGPRIELIKYQHPDGPTDQQRDQPNRHGIRHLAFRVKEMDLAVQRIKNAGARFFSEVAQVPESQVSYQGGVQKRLVYFTDPENNLLELCEYR